MNREMVKKALQRRLLVKLNRVGRPDQPYLGRLERELNDGTFWFKGISGSEFISGKVKPEEVSLVRKEERCL